MMRETISLQEAALAVQGARQRFDKATRELEDFFAEHGAGVAPPEECESIERQRHVLRVELDDARRQLQKATEDFEELKKCWKLV
jgi:hypothetical protein